MTLLKLACGYTSATTGVVPLNLPSHVLLHPRGRRSSLHSLPCPATLKPSPASFLSASLLASYYNGVVAIIVPSRVLLH